MSRVKTTLYESITSALSSPNRPWIRDVGWYISGFLGIDAGLSTLGFGIANLGVTVERGGLAVVLFFLVWFGVSITAQAFFVYVDAVLGRRYQPTEPRELSTPVAIGSALLWWLIALSIWLLADAVTGSETTATVLMYVIGLAFAGGFCWLAVVVTHDAPTDEDASQESAEPPNRGYW